MTNIIEKLKEAKDNFPSVGFDNEFVRGFNKAFQMAIFIVEELSKSDKIELYATQSTEPTNKPDFYKMAENRGLGVSESNAYVYGCDDIWNHHVQAMQEENERLKIEVNNWKILHDMVKESGIDKGKKAYERGELLAKADEIIDLIKDGIPLDFTNAVNTSGKEFLIKIEEYKSLKSTKPEDRPTAFFSDQPGGEL